MSNIEDLRADREKKIARLEELGVNPYPANTNITHVIEDVLADFDSLEKQKAVVTVGGRIVSFREHGAIAFIDVQDGTGKIQGFCSKEELGEELFACLLETMSTADFIEITGTSYITKRGTQALLLKNWRVLAKALQSIPTEHFGIKDEDERYRKRYLDILVDQDTREMFRQKALYWKASRRFLEDKGFAEVHTPMLETTTGGAEANPFVTYHDDFNMDVYLRISVGELWQKRLMTAGMTKVFEVGRVFRNEGSSPDHLQEFTNIEFYSAYTNFAAGLLLLEEHIRYVLDEAFAGQRVFSIKDFTVDFTQPFEKIDYVDTIEEMTGINVSTASDEELKAKITELEIEHEGDNRERLTDTLWKYCRKSIAGPVWLTGHTKLVSPLSKESDAKDGTVLRAQLVMAGAEFNNCYAELNDPVEQRERFETQAKLLAEGDSEAMMPDWEFVEMLEHGMPPTFGAATLGERFFAYLVDKSIRETQYFPLMRPKINSKDDKHKVAVAVVNKSAELAQWQVLNTVAHLSAELGVRGGKSLLRFDSVATKDGFAIPLNIQHAILIKETQDSILLLQLLKEAKTNGLETAAFTRDMLETTNDSKIKEQVLQKDSTEVEYLGVLVFGEQAEVEKLTNKFQLLK